MGNCYNSEEMMSLRRQEVLLGEGSRKVEQREGSRGFRGTSLTPSERHVSKGKGKEGDQPRPPLLAHLILTRKRSFSVFLSNLRPLISKAEIEAMFCRSGRIVDSFLSMDKVLGQKRGFAFVRFGTKEEANGDVAEGNGRSWRDKRIQVNLSKPELVATGKPTSRCPGQVASSVSKVIATPPSMAEEVYNDHLGGIKSKGSFAMVVAGKPNRLDEVWTI